MTQNEEIWKPIAGFEGLYDVSDQGNVRSYQNFGNKLRTTPKLLSPMKDRYGYFMVTLCKDGVHSQRTIHRLVAETFIKAPTNDLQVDHINGVKTDNRVTNLEWVTPKENTIRASNLGLKPHGEKHGNSKLTQIEVNEIRALYKTGKYTHRSLGEIFGVSHAVIGSIIRRETWR